jgi:transposase
VRSDNSVCPAKKSLHASERDTPRVQKWRAAWRQTRRRLDPQRLIFVDESGLNLAMTRLYGRAPRGECVIGSVPQNYGEQLTVLAALERHGIRATMTVEGATDGLIFLTFLQRVLCPQLQPGDIVVLDNLAAPRVTGVAEALAKVGAKLRYLPPYSPAYNPIEFAGSKMKTRRRSRAARTRPSLYRALCSAWQTITSQEARTWFRHDGYGLH